MLSDPDLTTMVLVENMMLLGAMTKTMAVMTMAMAMMTLTDGDDDDGWR